MNNLFKGFSANLMKRCKKTKQPTFVKPMLATLTKDYSVGSDWVYEHKFDGERCIAIKRHGEVSLLSRNRRKINNEYPELEKALLAQKADNFIIDGEIVALNKQGLSDFELLQSRINLKALADIKEKIKTVPIYYRIFDIMYAGGYDVRNLPLLARKKVLKKLLRFNKILTYTEHKTGNGLKLFKQACKRHWEGLIVKQIDSTYVSTRSRNWLKFKCALGQELVIGGYTEPQHSRKDFGALLVGYYKRGKLQFAGKVGTGFNYATLTMLGKKLRALEIKKCPFANYAKSTKGVHWVQPKLVAEFEFAQWTNIGRLRVPRYKGLRTDKPAKEVTQEIPK
jgi:bifunctional non-homologous end joining protein LigD